MRVNNNIKSNVKSLNLKKERINFRNSKNLTNLKFRERERDSYCISSLRRGLEDFRKILDRIKFLRPLRPLILRFTRSETISPIFARGTSVMSRVRVDNGRRTRGHKVCTRRSRCHLLEHCHMSSHGRATAILCVYSLLSYSSEQKPGPAWLIVKPVDLLFCAH